MSNLATVTGVLVLRHCFHDAIMLSLTLTRPTNGDHNELANDMNREK